MTTVTVSAKTCGYLKFLTLKIEIKFSERRGKRRRVSGSAENQEIEDRLESLILRVGEKSTSSLESNLEGLVSVLEADLGTFRNKILRILSECAVKMPGMLSYSIFLKLL